MKFFLEIYKTKTREGDSKDHRENDHLIPKVFEINSLNPNICVDFTTLVLKKVNVRQYQKNVKLNS